MTEIKVTLDLLRRVGANALSSRNVAAPVAEPKMHRWPSRRANGKRKWYSLYHVVSAMKIGDFMVARSENDRHLLSYTMRFARGKGCLQSRWSTNVEGFICTRVK